MKIVKYLSIVLAGLFLFVACQKELSVESGFAGKVATGSLLDSAGNCQNITVNGPYIVDSTLTSGDYVTVQVNVATGGSYKIFTDTQNGFFFQDSGFLAAGAQTIRLKATGRPILAKQTSFQVAFDTTFCSFTVTVIGKTPAAYTLLGSGGSCTTANVQGTYTTGSALTASNQVALQVNVTALGSYSITTAPVGGMTFNGTGTFTTLGAQSITLQGTGTPTTAGANAIPVTAGSSNCNFNVTVTAGSTNTVDNASDTAWQFTANGQTFHGPFYDVFDTTINGAYGLIFLGDIPPNGDTAIQFGAFSTTGSFPANSSYSSKSGFSAFYFTRYLTPTDSVGVSIYKANPPSTSYPSPTEDMKVTITAFDPATGTATGTFTGTALNAAGTPVPITNGRFRAKVR